MNKTMFNLWAHRYKLLLHIAVAIVAVALMTYYVAIPVYMDTHEATYTVTVTDKEYTGGRTLYLVFTKDEKGDPLVFENRDTILRGKFNSSNFQEVIHVGDRYTFRAVGYRWYYLKGWYPNIIEVYKINPDGTETLVMEEGR